MRYLFKCLAIMTSLITSPVPAQEMFDLLPSIPEGWHSISEDRLYAPDELYDYIDGGAELFLSYGMLNVVSRIISRGENEIRIEIFDMGTGENAFGVFSHTRSSDEQVYGQGSQLFTGTLIFWKNNYYVTLTANDSNTDIDTAIHSLATAIQTKIKGESSLPQIIELLPEEGLQKDGFLFFHHYIWQNAYHFIASDNFMLIDDSTNAILAKYGPPNQRYFLLIIRYADSKTGELAYTAFRERFLGEQPQDSLNSIEDDTWWGAVSLNTYLIAVMNAPSRTDAAKLISAVENSIHK